MPERLAPDDLVSRPWEYPGTWASSSGVLHRGAYRPLEATDLDGSDSRQLLVAVGSNASPSVVRRKLGPAAVDNKVPFLRATVTGLRIGHSGHVSRSGYVAATPVMAPTEHVEPVVTLLLDLEQLERLDRTEPNYERVAVPVAVGALDLEHGARPDGFFVYVSRWGALWDEEGCYLGFGSQEAVFGWLRSRSAAVRELFGPQQDLPTTMRALAADPALRARVRELLDAYGWVGPTGFEALKGRPA